MSNFAEYYKEQNEEKEPYKSLYGDFTYQQDLLIDFGSSPKMLVYWIMNLVVFAISILTAIAIWKLDFVRLFAGVDLNLAGYNLLLRSISILAVVMSSILPLAIGKVYIGTKNLDVRRAESGIKIASVYMQVIRVLLFIVIIFLVFAIIVVLIRSALLGLFLGALLGGLMFVYFKFVTLLIDFLSFTEMNFGGRTTTIPFVNDLKKYAWIIYIIIILGALISLLSGNSSNANGYDILDLYPQVGLLMDRLDLYSILSQVVGIITGGYGIYLLTQFEMDVYARRNDH